MKKLSIIIPMYNESNTITELLNRVIAVELPVDKEIIVVDDGSTDNSLELAKQFKDIIVLNNGRNRGKGYSIRVGLEHATGNIILIQDADLEYDPNDYNRLLAPILSGAIQVVYGSRRLGQKKIKGRPSYFIGGTLLTWVINILYGLKLTDGPTCYKMFTKEVIDKIELVCDRFSFCPEITAKVAKLGYKITEVPIRYTPRSIDEGKHIRWSDGIEWLWVTIKYRFIR